MRGGRIDSLGARRISWVISAKRDDNGSRPIILQGPPIPCRDRRRSAFTPLCRRRNGHAAGGDRTCNAGTKQHQKLLGGGREDGDGRDREGVRGVYDAKGHWQPARVFPSMGAGRREGLMEQ